MDDMLSRPEHAADMDLIARYAAVRKQLDDEVERWEKASEELEACM